MSENLARVPLSVAIVTHNEAGKIGACLDSVSWAEEVVVLDCHSTDETRQICRERGAKVHEQSWQGYAAQKNLALSKSRNPWILSLDADERIPAALRERICTILDADGPGDGYRIPRKNIFFGKWLRYGDHWPDHQIRLFRREKGRFNGNSVHESVEVAGRVEELNEPMEHLSYDSLSEFFHRQVRYAALAAEDLDQRGRAPGIADFTLRPLWRFLRSYLVKSGWRDGHEGFIAAAGTAFYVFMRAAYLRELRLKRAAS